MSRQINDALQTRTGLSKWLVFISVPVVCKILAFAVYFGFMPPGIWIERIGSIKDLKIPPIGLREVFVFIAAVNGLTLLIRKRLLAL